MRTGELVLLVRLHEGSVNVGSGEGFECAVNALCMADAAARPAALCRGLTGGG